MTMRRRFHSRRGRSPGRKINTTWKNYGIEFAMTAAAGPIVFSDLTPLPMRTQTDNLGSATILRLVGSVTFTTDGNTTSNPAHAAIGIYVLSDEAFDSLAFADPLADVQQPWYYWTFTTIANTSTPQVIPFDIRTSRRLRQGYRLMAVTNNVLNDQQTKITLSARAVWTQQVS